MTASSLLTSRAPDVARMFGAGDPASTRLVYAMVLGLVLVGVAFVILGIWLVRQTRHDLQALAPLERMGDRDWTRHDPSTQRRMLDEVRPEGAEPLRTERMPPTLDHDFEQSAHNVASLSDLGPGIASDDPGTAPADGSTPDPAPTADGADHPVPDDDPSDADESGDDDEAGEPETVPDDAAAPVGEARQHRCPPEPG